MADEQAKLARPYKCVRFAEPTVGLPPTGQKPNKRKHSDTHSDKDVVELEPSAKKSKKNNVAVAIDQDDNSLKRRLRPRKPKTTEAEPVVTKAGPAKKKPRVAQSRKSKTVETTKAKDATAAKKKIKIVRPGTSNKTSAQDVDSTTSNTKSSLAEESPVKDESSDDVQIIKSQRAVITIDSTDESSS
ncbi:hypothetical protein IL306_003713 [Fusarium sp. DS 682]|nr:hypothetical protein IL306_003713 [Fusarium sp. DS 682]